MCEWECARACAEPFSSTLTKFSQSHTFMGRKLHVTIIDMPGLLFTCVCVACVCARARARVNGFVGDNIRQVAHVKPNFVFAWQINVNTHA